MYQLNFNPNIMTIGPVEIKWYSLAYLLGFLFLYFCSKYCIKKNLIKNLNKQNLEDFLLYSILGILIGARILFFLFYNIKELFTLEVFQFWHGGMSFHGGLIGFIISAILFSRKHKIIIWKLLDVSAVVAIFSLMLGRIGNIINGELMGTPFNGPWCFIFPKYDHICRHPYPLYALISHLFLFTYLLIIVYYNRNKLKDFLGKRILTVNFLIGYGILRIITDIWKVDAMFLGIKTGQWLSIAMMIAGLILIKKEP